MHMKKQIFVRAAASAAVLILLSPLLAGAAAAVQPDVSRNGSGASADASAGPVRAESPRLSAKSAVLLDASTGRVLYASHAEDKSLIARPALHSYHLRMLHPVTGAVIDVTAPLPEDIQRLLKEERL